MTAWADGLNYYLHTHPQVKPRVITTFEPWMALSFSEGSIGGDIESVSIAQLEAFYGKNPAGADAPGTGSALPGRAARAHRIERLRRGAGQHHRRQGAALDQPAHVVLVPRRSADDEQEGLNAYGALTWGQFFIYQGFNEKAGWMHTSSGVDNIDEFLETIVRKDGKVFYKHGAEEREAQRQDDHHPLQDGHRHGDQGVHGLSHAPRTDRARAGRQVGGGARSWSSRSRRCSSRYGRTKTKNIAEYKQVMELHTNSSNDTLYADADGNIAYFHSNFVPKRNPKLDWSKPVDGSIPGQRLAGRARGGRQPERGEPAQRLGLQHQQLAVHGRRQVQQEEERLPRLLRRRRREPARGPRHPRARQAEGLLD